MARREAKPCSPRSAPTAWRYRASNSISRAPRHVSRRNRGVVAQQIFILLATTPRQWQAGREGRRRASNFHSPRDNATREVSWSVRRDIFRSPRKRHDNAARSSQHTRGVFFPDQIAPVRDLESMRSGALRPGRVASRSMRNQFNLRLWSCAVCAALAAISPQRRRRRRERAIGPGDCSIAVTSSA